jgi:DnaJ-class molecular chaperone
MEMWEFLADGNKLHSTFKQLEAKSPTEFKKAGMNRCGHCNATGLSLQNQEVACTQCIGVGFIGFKTIEEETIFPDCNASGKALGYENSIFDCKTCEGSGMLDWIEAVIKGVKLDKIW